VKIHLPGLDPCRERSVELERGEARRQRLPEHHLARLSRHVEDDPGGEEQRHTLGELALHLDVQPVGVRRLAVRATEEEAPLLVPLGMRDASPTEDQLDERGRIRNPDRRRDRVPAEGAGEHVRARAQERRRPSGVVHHRHRGCPVAHVERPVLGVARQGNRVPDEHLHLLTEATAAGGGLELQATHVDARRGGLVALESRAGALLAPVHRPGDPWAEGGRNFPRGERLGMRRGERGEQRRHEDETHA